MVFGGGPIIILVFSQLSQFCFYGHLLMESKKMRKGGQQSLFLYVTEALK